MKDHVEDDFFLHYVLALHVNAKVRIVIAYLFTVMSDWVTALTNTAIGT